MVTLVSAIVSEGSPTSERLPCVRMVNRIIIFYCYASVDKILTDSTLQSPSVAGELINFAAVNDMFGIGEARHFLIFYIGYWCMHDRLPARGMCLGRYLLKLW